MEKRFVYADYAATAPVDEAVLRAMLPYFTESFGNPSGIHSASRKAAKAVAEARRKIAEAIGADYSEIYFTSGGTESDNWAIGSASGVAAATSVEHKAVLNAVRSLGGIIIPADGEGLVTAEQVKAAITPDTSMVSVMYANNEIGTVMPIEEIGELCRERGIIFHSDAVQAIGKLPIDVKKQKIDMLSCSGHKIGAPKGTGFLYVRKGVRLKSLFLGGGQEFGLRAGTENVAGIVGLGEAVRLAGENAEENSEYVGRLGERLIEGLTEISDSRLNGSRKNRICGNVNVSFADVESETLLFMLDSAGICASGGSACTTGESEPSHVLKAIGVEDRYINGAIRFTLSHRNTADEVEYIIKQTSELVDRLRRIRKA